MADLVPMSRADLIHSISYALRFRRGKATSQHSPLMAELAAEALADMLEQSGCVVMCKPPLLGMAPPEGVRERQR